jgi:hypothetical protein
MLSVPLSLLPEVGLAVVFFLWLVATRRSLRRSTRRGRRFVLNPSARVPTAAPAR